ncbi:hypothetical protein [Scandinavium goeteborgense]|uniref:DUF1496 domain-containing protein n=1 Tax=Scandinavium goeteborgense TaxID=1851514 RepID=A0A4R6DSK3_SCAGO|nr:hypothetical protein [Scandinavium goeteborgense]TDN48090.1 hypothetical protein EC847_12841 [Scandinavium goeteborgense]
MKKVIIFLLALTANTTVSAVGIPLIDPSTPIKVSASSGYRCGSDEKGYVLNDGKWQLISFQDIEVSCHDDHLWLKDTPLSFSDILSQALKEIEKKDSSSQ